MKEVKLQKLLNQRSCCAKTLMVSLFSLIHFNIIFTQYLFFTTFLFSGKDPFGMSKSIDWLKAPLTSVKQRSENLFYIST